MTSVQHSTASPRTVVVLGLARSGTSVVTGMLKLLGVDMGPSVDDQSNPQGSNEDLDFAKLHKDIFDMTGEGKEYWAPPSREAILELAPKLDPIIDALVAKKGEGKAFWGWKHTRTLLTYELFLPHLVNPHFVLVFRNFLGTARSSVEHTRRRRNPVDFPQALTLVHFYHGEMLRFVEDHPEIPTHFVSYEDVVLKPLDEAQKLAGFLGIALTDETAREITAAVIPRERLPLEKKKMRSFLRGKLPRLIRKWSQDKRP
jgi:hypothetical protein